jgi:hypothetical protein
MTIRRSSDAKLLLLDGLADDDELDAAITAAAVRREWDTRSGMVISGARRERPMLLQRCPRTPAAEGAGATTS